MLLSSTGWRSYEQLFCNTDDNNRPQQAVTPRLSDQVITGSGMFSGYIFSPGRSYFFPVFLNCSVGEEEGTREIFPDHDRFFLCAGGGGNSIYSLSTKRFQFIWLIIFIWRIAPLFLVLRTETLPEINGGIMRSSSSSTIKSRIFS